MIPVLAFKKIGSARSPASQSSPVRSTPAAEPEAVKQRPELAKLDIDQVDVWPRPSCISILCLELGFLENKRQAKLAPTCNSDRTVVVIKIAPAQSIASRQFSPNFWLLNVFDLFFSFVNIQMRQFLARNYCTR